MMRRFAGFALVAGLLVFAGSAAVAGTPDGGETAAKPGTPEIAAPEPTAAPAAEAPAATASPAKPAPVKRTVRRPAPQPAANPWGLSRFFAQWQAMPLFGISSVPRMQVAFQSGYSPGTIVISTAERRLYYVLDHGSAIRYGIGVGRAGFTWGGVRFVTAKREWPDWTPPEDMLRRKPELPHFMKGGPENPLGARAMYLGDTLYRIHGTNEPNTIGTATSSGCFRMMNDDVVDLYNRVRVGTMVVIKQN
jgi:lipoprotein-anchoring transpeptidase ErfK/SrfK